jgi:hypothetical protein
VAFSSDLGIGRERHLASGDPLKALWNGRGKE